VLSLDIVIGCAIIGVSLLLWVIVLVQIIKIIFFD